MTHRGGQVPSPVSPGGSSPISAALAGLAALVAVAATLLPALATDTGARLSVWDARRLDGLMGALWVFQAAIVVLAAVTAGLLTRRHTRRGTAWIAVGLLLTGCVGSIVVTIQLLTFPRDIGDPPLEPAGGLLAVGVQLLLLAIAAASVLRGIRRRM